MSVVEELGRVAKGLDLGDEDDRATFRTRVQDRYANAKLSAIRADVRDLDSELRAIRPVRGRQRLGQSRADALRTLAYLYILARQMGDIAA